MVYLKKIWRDKPRYERTKHLSSTRFCILQRHGLCVPRMTGSLTVSLRNVCFRYSASEGQTMSGTSKSLADCRTVLRWGTRQLPQTSTLPPNDVKHCLTNSQHRYTGAKSSVLWPSKYAKICFQVGSLLWIPLGELTAPPKPPIHLGRGHPSPYLTPVGARHLVPQFGGGHCTQIFLSKGAPGW